jgi:hypothetical protein
MAFPGQVDVKREGVGWKTTAAGPCGIRLELLAFDARLAGAPPELLDALWEVIDSLGKSGAAGGW